MWMIIGIFFLMLLIGVPVAFGVGISSMLYLALNGKDLVILTQRIFAGGDSFTLMAIPLLPNDLPKQKPFVQRSGCFHPSRVEAA